MGRTLDFAPGAGTAGEEAEPTFPLTADADFATHKGINLGAPTNPNDAATKTYADGLITAIKNGAPAGGDTLNELDSRIAVVEALGSLATDAELVAAVAALLGSADTAGDTLGELQALIGLRMLKSANLSDVANAATSLANLGGVASSTLTTDGDLLTRAAGAIARITRANLAADAAFTAAFAPKATPLAFKVLTPDTNNRTKAGTAFAAMTGLAGLALDLTVGQVVELLASGYFSQSGASGSTSGKFGFVIDQPASADVNLKAAVVSSSDPGALISFAGWFTATEAGTHTFYIGAESGNAGNVEANGATIPTRFAAKNLGTPTA